MPTNTYTVADGLLRDSVYKIKQDSRGFLWFCTLEGISRFDGEAITNFTVADGLPSRFINDFLETKSGTIYIATAKGLARLNPHGLRASKDNPLFTTFLPDSWRAENIRTFFEDAKNQIFVGTSDGLYKLIEAKGEPIRFERVPLGEPFSSSGGAIAAPSPNALSISAILEDRRGTLWVGTYGSGLFRLSLDGAIRRFAAADELGDSKITDLLEDHDGQLWVSKRSDELGGVCLLDPADTDQPVRKCFTTKDGLGSNWVRDMLQTSDGQMWVATVPGLCRFQPDAAGGSVCKTYSVENDLCDDMLALAEDKDGNLWTGSSCGAKKIARYGFTTYTAADGLNHNHVNSVFENSSGELFATTFPRTERVVSRFDGNRFISVKPRLPDNVDYHGWGWQQTVWQDSCGAWWIPTGLGLFRSPNNTSFEKLASAPLKKQETGAKGTETFRLFEDSRGDVWVATFLDANEIFRWERAKNHWHNYTAQAGFSGLRIGSALAEDKHGNVWIGATSEHGDTALIRFSPDEKFLILRETEGAPSGWIQDLFFDSRGRLWLASDNEGLWRLDQTNTDRLEFVKYTTANGLSSNSTAAVTEDAFGRIYVGTWRGVDRITLDTGQIENYTTAVGLPASYVEAAYRDRQNNLWFATDKGLARFVPEPQRTRHPPNIFITGLGIEGAAQSISILGETTISTLDLNAEQRQITIDFLGLGASLGERLKYEYRFGNADWTPTTERTVNFANLAAGEYLFEVRAVTADRIYSNAPATVSFRIAAPIWQRWWFVTGVIVLTTMLGYGIYRIRVARLLEMERIRTRIATDLHDDIGANLTRISLLSEVARQGNTANDILPSISDIARESVSSMNDIVWTISPRHQRLLDLTRRMRQHAGEVFTMRDIDLSFNAPSRDVDLKLGVGVRRDLLLIFKEAVNNAAKHSNCTQVWIELTVENNILKLEIADNGQGFDDSTESDGQGLQSMTRRAAALGGKLEIDTRQGEGTIIKFVLGLKNRSDYRL